MPIPAVDNIDMEQNDMNNIFDYLDYRDFLKDRIEFLRESNPNFSYRYFKLKAGFSSTGYLKMVVDGDRNLGDKGIGNICRGFGLTKKESKFFESLVNLTQATTSREKELYYNELISLYPPKHPKLLEVSHYKIFCRWYYVAILELVQLDSFEEDPKWIAKKLKHNIPVWEIKRVIKELLEMKLIKRSDNGILARTDNAIGTPEVIKSVAVTKFHEELTTLAIKALKEDAVEDKEFATLTIATDDIKKLKRKVRQFVDEIQLLYANSDSTAKEVVNLNLQLFKLTSGEA